MNHEFNPKPELIADQHSFDEFLSAWSVARTIAKERARDLRHQLADGLLERFSSGHPEEVDRLAEYLQKKQFSSKDPSGKNRLPLSLCSKLAMFCNPSKYMPLDSLNRAGLRILGRKASKGTYVGFLSDALDEFDNKWRVGVEHFLNAQGNIADDAKRCAIFQHRFFDHILRVVPEFRPAD